MSSIPQEVLTVNAHDSGLVWLCDISEHHIDHANKHSVLQGLTSVSDNGDNIGSLLRHVHQVSSGSMGELHCIDHAILNTIIKRRISYKNKSKMI